MRVRKGCGGRCLPPRIGGGGREEGSLYASPGRPEFLSDSSGCPPPHNPQPSLWSVGAEPVSPPRCNVAGPRLDSAKLPGDLATWKVRSTSPAAIRSSLAMVRLSVFFIDFGLCETRFTFLDPEGPLSPARDPPPGFKGTSASHSRDSRWSKLAPSPPLPSSLWGGGVSLPFLLIA